MLTRTLVPAESRDRLYRLLHSARLLRYLSSLLPVALIGTFGAIFTPVLGVPGLVAFVMLFAAVPTLSVAWYLRLRRVHVAATDHADVEIAKQTVVGALLIWASSPLMAALAAAIVIILKALSMSFS